MFFDLILLNPQHNMMLNLPWQAATLGLSSIKKNKILEADIVSMCKHIKQFLLNDSNNPSKRMSLRLSSTLIHGVLLLFSKQTAVLLDDCSTIQISFTTSPQNQLATVIVKTTTGNKRRTRKKKCIEILTPESIGVRLELLESNFRPEILTEPVPIPDNLERRSAPSRSNIITQMGSLAIERNLEHPILQIEPFDENLQVPQLTLEDIVLKGYQEPAVDSAVTTAEGAIEIQEEYVEPVTETPEVAAKVAEAAKETPEAAAVAPAAEIETIIEDVVTIVEPPTEIQQHVLPENISAELRVSQEAIPEVVSQPPTASRPAERKRQREIEKPRDIFLKLAHTRHTPLTKQLEFHEEEPPKFQFITTKIPKLRVIAEFWLESTISIPTDIIAIEQEQQSTPNSNLRGRSISSEGDPRISIDSARIAIQALTSTPIERVGRKSKNGSTIRKTASPIIGEPMVQSSVTFESIRPQTGLQAVEPLEQIELVEQEPVQIPFQSQAEATSSLRETRRFVKDEDWKKGIMATINMRGKLEMKEICVKMNLPLKRHNIAKIFTTLMGLYGQGHIRLHKENNSLELKWVERGNTHFNIE